MKNLIAWIATLVLACGCGGADDIPTQIDFAGKKITVDSHVTLATGNVIREGDPPPCSTFFVGGSFTADPSPFPDSVTVSAIFIVQGDKAIWQGIPDAVEAHITGDGVLHHVARSCVPAGLDEGLSVVVIYELTGPQGSVRLASPPVTVTLSV